MPLKLFKLIRVASVVIRFTLAGVLTRIRIRDPLQRRMRLIRNLETACVRMARALHLKVDVIDHRKPDPATRGQLFVCNHLSYLDVVALAPALHATFVTSMEVHDEFFTGTMCRMGGCFFVERRNRSSLKKEIAELAQIMESGVNVVVFPEGTTSNGQELLPFKRALLLAGVKADVPIVPVYLQYPLISGAPPTESTRDHVFYYGEMSFFPHLIQLLKTTKIQARVTIFDALPSTTGDGESGTREVAEAAFQRIHSAFEPHVKDPVVKNLNLARN